MLEVHSFCSNVCHDLWNNYRDTFWNSAPVTESIIHVSSWQFQQCKYCSYILHFPFHVHQR
jgi:hypothetical protein